MLWLTTSLVLGQGWEAEDTGDAYRNIDFSTPTAFAEESFGASKEPSNFAVSAFPKILSFRNDLPIPGDQGKSLSCVSWSCGYGLLSYLSFQYIDPRPTTPRDPMYMHHWVVQDGEITDEELKNGFKDRSGKFSSAFGVIRNRGGIEYGGLGDFKISPKAAIINKAKIFSIAINPKRIGTENLVFDVKKSLNAKRPVPAGFWCDSSFDEGKGFEMREQGPEKRKVPVWVKPGAIGENRYKHAMLIIGYDDTISAFEVMNSWGESWGDDGYIWVDYQFLADQGADRDERLDNPCCISAYTYVVEEDLDASTAQGWVRMVDAKGESNFKGVDANALIKKDQVLEVKEGLNELHVRKAVIPLAGAGGKPILTSYGFLYSIQSGDRFKVSGLQQVDVAPNVKEYWVRGKRLTE